MQINVESQMRLAAVGGVDAFQPVFRGEALRVEAGIPEVSLENLRKMLGTGLKVASMVAVENGHILIVFKTGETYLATGFSIGEDSTGDMMPSDLTKAFAEFAAEAFPGTLDSWEEHLTYFYQPGYIGTINPAFTPINPDDPSPKLKAFAE